ncbi:DUF7002 family protein [Cryobacterium arcticum]|uniref:Uncharacterized protein n=1 Tax=Cryobacterium arcticum TaxID=670052 RepID=A0A317ZTM2_9MICO|nr:hypothetical protein [Cryobacterium arcticum]PXA68044.1 hypothetical protein CTB96_15440 [Cryobacterium arcticum]
MLTKDLIRLYPELYHVAADGSWPAIERHGLLSVSALVTRWGVRQGAPQAAILTRRRGETLELEHPDYGTAVIRHQKAMHESSLAAALEDDLTPSEWYAMLNDRVFFFLQKTRLNELLAARSYRDDAHTVITVDTRSLVAAHEDDIELTTVNTGFAQRFSAEPRGRDSFQSIEEFSHPTRAHASTKVVDVAELAVYRGVRDITKHVKRVERMRDGTVLERFV